MPAKSMETCSPVRMRRNISFEALTQSSYAKAEMITVLVGPKEVPFNIHKDLLCAQSPYCAARLSGSWKDDHTTGLKFPDFKAWPFSIIFDWLYSGNISVHFLDFPCEKNLDLCDSEIDDDDHDDDTPGWLGWLELYRTADLLLMTELPNQMVDHDLAYQDRKEPGGRWGWDFCWVTRWHEKNITHTPYYQLFLDDAVENLQTATIYEKDWYDRKLETMLRHPQCLADLLRKIYQWTSKSAWGKPTLDDRCKYHIHKSCETSSQDTGA